MLGGRSWPMLGWGGGGAFLADDGVASPADLAGVVTMGVASLADAGVASLADTGVVPLTDAGVVPLADAGVASLADAGVASLADDAGVASLADLTGSVSGRTVPVRMRTEEMMFLRDGCSESFAFQWCGVW